MIVRGTLKCVFLTVVVPLVLSLSAVPITAAGGERVTAPEAAAKKNDSRKKRALEIRVVDGGWGNARPKDIETVLYSVAEILLEHFPGRRLHPILVAHYDEYPITLYKKGAGNEYRVYLSAKDRHWARYVYEFAHELGHILTNYDRHTYSNTTNQWFEEALCEVASLYALKRLASVWKVSPPRPHWAAYASEFERYVERFLGEEHRRLPPNTSLAAWFQQNRNELRGNPYLRSLNEVVANLLLPLFEQYPEFWGAVGYLNVEAKGSSFQEYMQTWKANAPEAYKGIINYMMGSFGVLEDADSTVMVSREAPLIRPVVTAIPQDAAQTGPAGSPLR